VSRLLRRALGVLAIAGWLVGCPPSDSAPTREVVVYCALDRLYAQPILEAFSEETGIVVKPKWDTEATKTTGLVAALRAESEHPRCDVFWNNEVSQTIGLTRDGLLAPYESPAAEGLPAWALPSPRTWTGFAARARVLIVNIYLVPE
jgi:iron(III) transport system substrate-binding protein